ncbi:PREDICTED: TATA box-binding protein-associated factor RNA polymerase I subunit B isoform X2 [Nelumbo nucifera]|uniref:TATA box-binding protein-associated factor RNA polymerase I subunit B isoform X2 n=1 Tax=Nelumbo nucifera TaxID=4432 RepID=A0A1U8A0Z1_NELNU|nr:PREDICTED: TATA box-binding protein-associated factor RNA polymerase I subunit B isoform X2 [Nelumbo nucifera]
MAEALMCHACGNVGLDSCNDGFYYCLRCGSQAEDIVETGVADEDFLDKGDARGAIYTAGHRRHKFQRQTVIKVEPLSQSQPPYYQTPHTQQSQFWKSLGLSEEHPIHKAVIKKEEPDYEEMRPSVPNDFASTSRGLSPEDYYSQVRVRYVMGIQLMIQFQCQALVEKFGVSPLICSLSGVIWLRLVAVSRVFDDGWADEAMLDSEVQAEEPEVHKPRAKYSAEPHNIHGQRAVIIWIKSLKKKIPLSCSLAVSYLACHIAREAILPTDILRWTLEGKLPYLAAFVDIEKLFGQPSSACPVSSRLMFRPSRAVGLQKLESMAASIAQSIGLQMPPVNFYAIAYRYLNELSLPVEKILPHASRIYEWLMPPELWLSANEFRLPTRVCVMSIIMVAIRILYNINGFGIWEASLSSSGCSSSSCNQEGRFKPICKSAKRSDNKNECSPSSDSLKIGEEQLRSPSRFQKSEMELAEFLHDLETTYDKICYSHEYTKDLQTYLRYCKDVVFAGLEPTIEDNEEEKIIEQLWDFYEKQEDSEPSKVAGIGCCNGLNHKRSKDGAVSSLPTENKKRREEVCISSISIGNKRPGDEGCTGEISSDNGISDVDTFTKWSLDANDCSLSSQEQSSVPEGSSSAETLKDKALRQLKINMEENRFYYIPPRVNPKRFDYIHYVRKNDGGSRTYVAHADYYILLRACARLAQVDLRNMHAGVLKLERRLAWVEHRIGHCLQLWSSMKESLDG